MALLFIDGFEGGDITAKWNYPTGNLPTASTLTRFDTGYSLRTPSGSGGTHSGMKKFIPASTDIIMGVAFMSNTLAANRSMIILSGDSGTTHHLSVSIDQPTGALRLYRGDYTTLLATSAPGLIVNNKWCYIEISATIADAGGSCTVRHNGVDVITYAGDTKNGGTNTSIDSLILQSAAFGSNGSYYYWDDLYVCDATGPAPHNTFLGETRIYALSPTGAGTSTDFTPSTGANFAAVDELPYSATDYVSGSSTGLLDTYAMADLPASAANVLAVQTNLIARKTDAAPISLKPAIKSGSTMYYGDTTPLTSNDASILDLRTTDPSTSTAWTVGGVNTLEAGMETA